MPDTPPRPWGHLPEAFAYREAADARGAAMRAAVLAHDTRGPGSPEEGAAARALGEARERFRAADRAFADAVRREQMRRAGEAAGYEPVEPYEGLDAA